MPQIMPPGIPIRSKRRIFARIRAKVYVALMIFLFIAAKSEITFAQDNRQPTHSNWPSLVQLAQNIKDYATDGADFTVIFKGRATPSAEALKMVAQVNQERMDAGLTKLELDPCLVKLAEEKSQDMVRYNYFGHISKVLGTIYDQLDRSQFPYKSAAENLIGASNYRRAENAAIASPAHQSNILNPHFRKIGIGITRGGPYGEMIVQILVD